MKNLKPNKGITLIALIITIIILLILVGVTIRTLTGENGILKKANTAQKQNDKKTAEEIMNLKITNTQIESYAKTQKMPNLQYLADKLCEDLEIDYVLTESKKTAKLNDKINVEKAEFIYKKLEAYPYEFKIDSNLRLASINGIEIADNSNMVSKDDYNKLLQAYDELENNYNTTISSALNEIGIETNNSETLTTLTEKIKNIKTPRVTKLTIDGVGYKYSNIYHFYLTNYNNYQNLTLDNLTIQLNTSPFRSTQQSDLCGRLYYSFNYTPETGLTIIE